MTEGEHIEQHAGPSFATYMIIFGILAVCTTISFLANAAFGIGSMSGLAIIMAVSIVKATLVALYFMHLKWDWGRIFFLMVPVVILTVMMVIVLMPDTVQSTLQQSAPPSYGPESTLVEDE